MTKKRNAPPLHRLAARLILIATVMGSGSSMAQHYKNYTLNFRNGIGPNNCLEEGTSPLRYSGPGLNLGTDLTFEWRRNVIVYRQDISAALLSDSKSIASGYGGYWHGSIGYLYRWSKPERPSYRGWVGGGIGDQQFITVNSSLGNAAFGHCNFFDVELLARVELDFKIRKKKEEKRFTAFGALQLPLITSMHRPGYAYIPNANANEIGKFKLTDDSYESIWKAFSGVITETGIAYRLRNQNRIALSYGWHFRNTGKKGIYRFDHAQHLFQCEFTFNFKHRENEN